MDFVDRIEELAFLNQLVTRLEQQGRPQLVLMYGRRRVGKTALLNHWVRQAGVTWTYWVADKEPADLQRRSLLATVMGFQEANAPHFQSWPELWRWLAPQLAARSQPHILILDELSYAADADSGILSALQHAWDQHLQQANIIIVLCGSHVNTMEALLAHQSPLFGRFTGQWHLKPLPFSALAEFFPAWTLEERIALAAIVGTIPAYLKWLDPQLRLSANIRDVMLADGSMFSAESTLMLYDELHEPRTYLAILKAIASGHHTVKAIADACLIGSQKVGFYLSRLQTLYLVERRLPATMRPSEQRNSRRGRYHLTAPWLRFYFRFIQPHQRSLMRPEETVKHIEKELRPFVAIGYERICQQWMIHEARHGRLPIVPEAVGAHWSKRVQIDVVAINHQTRELILGECKWGANVVGRAVVEEMVGRKTEMLRTDLLDNDVWQIRYMLFTRTRLSKGAAALLNEHDGIHVPLSALENGLP